MTILDTVQLLILMWLALDRVGGSDRPSRARRRRDDG